MAQGCLAVRPGRDGPGAQTAPTTVEMPVTLGHTEMFPTTFQLTKTLTLIKTGELPERSTIAS